MSRRNLKQKKIPALKKADVNLLNKAFDLLDTRLVKQAVMSMVEFIKSDDIIKNVVSIADFYKKLPNQNSIDLFNQLIDKEIEDTLIIRHGLASALQEETDYISAVEQLELLKNRGQSNYNTDTLLGILYGKLGEIDKSKYSFEIALKESNNLNKIKFNQSIISILTDSINKNNLADYELGIKTGHRTNLRKFSKPYWNGEDLSEKTLLISHEQGIGDEIKFASHIPNIIKHTGKCIIETREKLVPLFKRSFPQANVSFCNDYSADNRRDDFDYYCLIGSLRYYDFIINGNKHEPSSKFLIAENSKIEYWKHKINEISNNNLKVAICWKSSLTTKTRKNLYPGLENFIDLLKNDKVTFFNANYAEGSDIELNDLHKNHGLSVYNFPELDQKDDLDSTAAYLSHMDLVISSGTAVDELAAGLGVNVWKIVNMGTSNDMKLKKHHFDSPNTYRIEKRYNQDWKPVFDVAKKHLEEYASSGKYPKLNLEQQ